MKVGILALLRAGKKLEYLTNRERWDWMLHSNNDGQLKELAVKFVELSRSSASVMNDPKVTVYYLMWRAQNYLMDKRSFFINRRMRNTDL